MEYFTSNDGVKLAYEVQGEGKPLLLLSGYAVPVGTMESLAEKLRPAGYQTILAEQRGIGASETLHYGERLSRHAKDLKELTDLLDLKDVVFIGHSMGASVIFAYYSLFGAERMAGIIDIDQSPKMLSTEDWEYGICGVDENALFTFMKEKFPKANYIDRETPSMQRYISTIKSYPRYDEGERRALLFDHMCADWRDVLGRITVPILFIAGKNSPYWDSRFVEVCAKMCRNGEYEVIEECGHCVPWEQEEACVRAVMGFLKRIKTPHIS